MASSFSVAECKVVSQLHRENELLQTRQGCESALYGGEECVGRLWAVSDVRGEEARRALKLCQIARAPSKLPAVCCLSTERWSLAPVPQADTHAVRNLCSAHVLMHRAENVRNVRGKHSLSPAQAAYNRSQPAAGPEHHDRLVLDSRPPLARRQVIHQYQLSSPNLQTHRLEISLHRVADDDRHAVASRYAHVFIVRLFV
mmetsp:Transcript_25778/g.84853  ORF Transcript_25778/g.84853 Transcript_25778/m.84853 type:complete len:200 (-) Transcript_25778:138-737(-)